MNKEPNNETYTEAVKQQAEGDWEQFTGRLKEAWGALTDDDIQRLEGRKDQLIGSIKEKTGEAQETIARKIDELASQVGYVFEEDRK